MASWLLYGDTEKDANLRYLIHAEMMDPMVAMRVRGKTIGVFSKLEWGRAQRTATVDVFHELTEVFQAAQKTWDKKLHWASLVILEVAKRSKEISFEVSNHFPLRIADEIKAEGITLKCKDSLIPQRMVKTETEQKYIAQANKISAAGLKTAYDSLKASEIQGNYLVYKGKKLTSEFLRELISKTCLEKGGLDPHTIVAGGIQGTDPHERGTGYLRPHELIVVDIFPKSKATGYHGDMTRTFLKGKANEAQKKLVKAVADAHNQAIAAAQASIMPKQLHLKADDILKQHGFKTEMRGDKPVGFFHTLGHGLGLEVHEMRRVGPKESKKFKVGEVVTIEPGLYYPEIGGCRIEDVIAIEEKGCKLLSNFHYRWQIK